MPLEINWARAAVPQSDLYDARLSVHLASTTPSLLRDTLYVRREVGAPPALFDGTVSARYCYSSDFYPGLVDAPLDHPHLALAAELVGRWRVAWDQFRILMDSVHPLLVPGDPDNDPNHFGFTRSHSEEQLFGTLMASVNSPVMLAECLVHEMSHQKLRAFGISFEAASRFIRNPPEEGYESPLIKDRLRPMTAVFHAVYSHTYVAEMDLRIIAGEADTRRMDKLLRRLTANVQRIEQGRSTLNRSLLLDDEGEVFMAPYRDWLDDVIARGRTELGGTRHRP